MRIRVGDVDECRRGDLRRVTQGIAFVELAFGCDTERCVKLINQVERGLVRRSSMALMSVGNCNRSTRCMAGLRLECEVAVCKAHLESSLDHSKC